MRPRATSPCAGGLSLLAVRMPVLMCTARAPTLCALTLELAAVPLRLDDRCRVALDKWQRAAVERETGDGGLQLLGRLQTRAAGVGWR